MAIAALYPGNPNALGVEGKMEKDDGKSREDLLRELNELREQAPGLRRTEEECMLYSERLEEMVRERNEEVIRAREEAERRTGELDAAIHAIADGVMIFGPDRRLVRINTVALHLLQFTPEMVGSSAEEILRGCCMKSETGVAIPPRDTPILRAFEGETIFNEPVVFLSGEDFSARCISFSAAPMRSREGRPMGVIATFQDVTRQRNLQRQREELLGKVKAYATELEQANLTLEKRVRERTRELSEAHAELKAHAAELERTNEDLQDFAFVASHDLQEPLRKIQTFGDRLKFSCKDSLGSAGLDYLTRMESSAKRMRTLLDGLLSYSKITTKANPFTASDLTILAEHALSDLDIAVEQAKAKVTVEKLPVVAADQTQMRQVFQNLISNALKYSDKDRLPEVRIYGEVNSDYCRVFVEDNGIGFDEKYLDRIFKPFQRLHGKGVYEGTGMGLAICRKIVERHGGTITARSTPGQGSTFIITMRLGNDSNMARRLYVKRPSPPGDKCSIRSVASKRSRSKTWN